MLSFLDNWLTLIFTAVFGYFLFSFIWKKRLNLPPGPWGLPLVGYGPFIRGENYRFFSELGKIYGDVMCVNVFGTRAVILNSYDAIKECYSLKGEEFSGRPINKNTFFWFLGNGLGFLLEEGPTWREHRRFALHTLRDFGFGKLSLEARVQEIGEDLLHGLSGTKGKPYDPMNLLANAAFNVILYLTTDKHFQPDDPDFRMIRRNIRHVLTQGAANFLPGPLSSFLPLNWLPGFSDISRIKKQFHHLSGKIIKEHEETFQENNLRDFIDVFLAERYSAIKEGKNDTTFTVERLTILLLNLLLAGTETTSNTLYWTLRVISTKPEVQAKIQKELDEVVGKDRLPSILDRPNLPYTDAVILEILRFTTIAPLGVPHSNPAAAKLQGYDIPARSIIMGNLWAVHNDPEFWEDPEVFNPERFMDDATKAKRRERIVTFSIGKRSCLGESLARMELFLFLTMMLQKFTFHLPKEDKGELKVRRAFVRLLEPYTVCADPRF